MQINVNFLENLRLEAEFDDYKIITDQPIRYKGDGTAPSPFDYFLASSALCAAYFVKVYCKARDIETSDIKLTQNNIIDPENRYNQTFDIQVELPDSISEKDKKGILNSMNRCTVKRVIQEAPKFKIEPKNVLGKAQLSIDSSLLNKNSKTLIPGKDASLEVTIDKLTGKLAEIGINIEIASWRNPIPYVWSVHVRDADSPICYTNGKGATKDAALCSALGEYFERISNNYFYNDYYLGQNRANAEFVHYPNEKWFQAGNDDSIPSDLMDEYLLEVYSNDGDLKPFHLIDSNSANLERGICALPFIRQSDLKQVYIPVNILGNLFVSNGMSAGNSIYEARVQCLSEIFERNIKNKIITEEIVLPEVPRSVLEQYPQILQGVEKLESLGYPIYVKDASLGGLYPVMCVTLMNPKTGGVFASFGSHPKFEVALERSLTELLQGRSFEGLNDMPAPTFNEQAITEFNNIVDHFIDSTGVISWNFFSDKYDYEFQHWNYSGSTEDEFNYLMNILKQIEKEVYIADYTDLGVNACRIIVPNFSEIYPSEDLIWDNNNKGLYFRDDILNVHQLDKNQLHALLNRLDDTDLDDYMKVSELIGVAFDETSNWGQLTINELKLLSLLALERFEDAKEIAEMLMTFSDHLPERKKYFCALNTILDIKISDELELNDFISPLRNMFGPEIFKAALESVNTEVRFYGLDQTNLDLTGVDKHLRLLESYEKLCRFRSQSN